MSCGNKYLVLKKSKTSKHGSHFLFKKKPKNEELFVHVLYDIVFSPSPSDFIMLYFLCALMGNFSFSFFVC